MEWRIIRNLVIRILNYKKIRREHELDQMLSDLFISKLGKINSVYCRTNEDLDTDELGKELVKSFKKLLFKGTTHSRAIHEVIRKEVRSRANISNQRIDKVVDDIKWSISDDLILEYKNSLREKSWC